MLERIKIEQLKGVGEKISTRFNKLGIDNVGALFEFYPRRYEDWSNTVSISAAPIDESCCIKATICSDIEEKRTRQGMIIYKFAASDGIGELWVTIFNNRYLAKSLEFGKEYLFLGKCSGNMFLKEMNSPQIKKVNDNSISPVYNQTQGLNSRFISKIVKSALISYSSLINEVFTEEICSELELCKRKFAISRIHFPKSFEEVKIAKKRLVFEELLVLQLGLLKLRGRKREESAFKITKDYTKKFIESMPFELTNAQAQAIHTAIVDMARNRPMNRLLQGDVGSGKTAVAAALLYNVARNGFQGAMMAPTEILANQHFETLSKIFEPFDFKVALLTGSTPKAARNEILQKLRDKETDIIVGTHALIQGTVNFSSLALVITDEQHRFGVKQRSALTQKSENPHCYVMSATPIPRTLALIVYGDLDISILNERPKGRQEIKTYVIDSSKRDRAFGYVKKQLDAGYQGYVVCPLVEDSESDLISATGYYEQLKSESFKNYSVGLLHGKMKASEKEVVMSAFSSGEIQLLVATTVIEVGVDVPNSTIMVIENAERFGLSQLHQLRGRIGRGTAESSCILISDATNQETIARLETMKRTNDGFLIAEEDLKMRGPGNFFGQKQHGLPDLKIADLSEDLTVLQEAKDFAIKIIKDDPNLEKEQNKGLKRAVLDLFSNHDGELN